MAEALQAQNELKLPPQKFLKLAVLFSSVYIAGGILLGARGVLQWTEVAWRCVLIACLVGLVLWTYRRLGSVARNAKPENLPWLQAFASVLLLAVFFGGGIIMLSGTPFSETFSVIWFILPFSFGINLAGHSFTRRVGHSLHCPGCEYEFAFADDPHPPVRCPECGSGWLGLLRKGRKIRSVPLMALGAAIAIIGGLLLSPFLWLPSAAPYLPTPVLYAALYAAPRPAYSAWDELALRPLHQQAINTMVRRVLTDRATQTMPSPSTQWFATMMKAGKISPEVQERFFREGWLAELHAPALVKVGETFTVNLRVRHVANDMGDQPVIYFAGYAIDDAELVGRQPQSLWAFKLRPQMFSIFQDVLPQELTLSKAGPARVRAVYWLLYQPSFWEYLAWQPDGTPTRPAAATWFKRIEQEITVVGE